MLILGIDPGYAIVGYGIIQAVNGKYAPVEYGAITTPAGQEFNSRLEEIYDGVVSLLKKYRVDAVSIEKLFFYSNKTTVIGVAEARGVILLAAQKAGVQVYEYTPNEVKIAVTGYGRALKPQVMEMTRRLLTLPSVPKPDDTADALAIAICHGQATASGFRRALLRG